MALDYDREEVELPQEIEEFLNERLGDGASVEVEEISSGEIEVRGEEEEWLFLGDENAADEKAVEYTKELLEEIEDFSNIQYVDWKSYVDEGFFQQGMEESSQTYIEDIKRERGRLRREMREAGVKNEDEFLEYLCDNDPVDWAIESYGDRTFAQIAIKHRAIDLDGLAREIVETDGRGNELARYDGEEHELGGGWLGYRQG